MDFKELKKQIIDEINTKIVSLITHPTFEKSIFKESAEYKGMFIKPAIKQLYDKYLTLHLPLSLIINPKHKYANRYVNHMICFKAYNYYHTNGGNVDNILDYIEISGPTWCFNTNNSPLSARSIETLIAMNSVLENYNELYQHREEIIMKFISNFESNISIYFQLSKHNFCKIKTATKNADMGGIDITYSMLEISPYHRYFGKFREDYALKKFLSFEELSKISLVSEEEINDYLAKSVDDEISKYEKEIKKAEKQISNFNVSINLLKNLKTTI